MATTHLTQLAHAREKFAPVTANDGFKWIAPLQVNATMSQTTIEVRQQNLDATDSMAQFESPDGDDVCASYISRNVADSLGEFATLTIDDDADVTADRQKETTNYAVYETAGGAVTGLYIARSVFGEDAESPESIGLEFAESDEESFEEAQAEKQEEAEEEAEGLLADDSDDSDDEDEVEITDEELELTAD